MTVSPTVSNKDQLYRLLKRRSKNGLEINAPVNMSLVTISCHMFCLYYVCKYLVWISNFLNTTVITNFKYWWILQKERYFTATSAFLWSSFVLMNPFQKHNFSKLFSCKYKFFSFLEPIYLDMGLYFPISPHCGVAKRFLAESVGRTLSCCSLSQKWIILICNSGFAFFSFPSLWSSCCILLQKGT